LTGKTIAASALAAHLERHGPPPVVAAIGPETLLRDEVLRTVAAQVLGDADSPHLVIVQGAAGSAEFEREAVGLFFDEARSLSLFGERKVVALRNAHALAGRHAKLFESWLSAPSSAVTCVVLAHALPAKLDKAFGKHALVVRCGGRGRQSGEPPVRFVARKAEERGKRLGPHEAEYLVELLGGELQGLDHAVEMLALLAGTEQRITREHVEALFTSGREGSIWEFGDKLVEGDVAGALLQAERCYAEGIPERVGSLKVTRNEASITIRLLSAFTRAAQRGALVRRQLDRGVPRDQISWGPGRPPFPSAQRRIFGLVRSRSPGAFDSLMLFAEETERALKSGGATGRTAVTRLALAAGLVR